MGRPFEKDINSIFSIVKVISSLSAGAKLLREEKHMQEKNPDPTAAASNLTRDIMRNVAHLCRMEHFTLNVLSCSHDPIHKLHTFSSLGGSYHRERANYV